MQPTKQIKHSKLGVIAFSIFLSPLVPLLMIYFFRGGILHKIFSHEQVLLISDFFTYWIISAPMLGFVLSIIDLNKPDRLRILPKVTVVLSSIIFGIGILLALISTISDVSRVF